MSTARTPLQTKAEQGVNVSMIWMGDPTECALNSIRARQNKSAIVEDLQENMILSRTQFKT